MMYRADRSRYRNLVEDLQNNFALSKYGHPLGITESYNLLLNHKSVHSKQVVRLVDNSQKVSLINVGEEKGGGGNKSGGGGGSYVERKV